MSLKLDNLIRLFDYLSPYTWRTAEQVAGELEVDRRTVFRYMREIEMAFSPVPIVESSRDGYRLCRNDFLDVMQSRDDYAGLAAVMSTPLGSLVQPEHPLPERFLTSIREMVETRETSSAKILRPIFEAMRTGCFLELSYRAKSEAKAHRCVPVKFFLRSGIPYIVSFDEDYCHLIVLAADKIERAAKSRKFLPVSELKELRTYVNGAWGLMIRHKERLVTEVEFEANASVATYFEKAPLHASQKLIAKPGCATFRLRVHNEGEFVRYLLRFGQAVRIISPSSAISELTGFLATMREFYERSAPIEFDTIQS